METRWVVGGEGSGVGKGNSTWIHMSLWAQKFFFFFNDTATTEIYTLSLHDALPISGEWTFGSCSRKLLGTVLGVVQQHTRAAQPRLRRQIHLVRSLLRLHCRLNWFIRWALSVLAVYGEWSLLLTQNHSEKSDKWITCSRKIARLVNNKKHMFHL